MLEHVRAMLQGVSAIVLDKFKGVKKKKKKKKKKNQLLKILLHQQLAESSKYVKTQELV